MKKNIIRFVIFFCALTIYSQEEVTTYYLIRHAEKKMEASDPGINNEGIKRTKKWLNTFKNISFDAIYSTDYKRTKQTAKPIADANNLSILSYKATNLYSDTFKYNTYGKTVLIVGHSNTTPYFVNTILGKEKYKLIDENNYSNLYIVTNINNKTSSILLHID